MLEHVRQWRARGGQSALVTAADQTLANAVANHLDLFDAVHGSDGAINLKGPAKAEWLRRTYGAGSYVYAGDSTADLPVWQTAAGAVTVGLRPGLRARVDALHPDAVHLAPPAPIFPAALRAMRPQQWVKNLLVFLPMLAAHQFGPHTLAQGLVAFLAFSLVASSVYLLNDLLDIGSDRAHPRKRNRPLASGALPLSHGMAMVPLLLAMGLGLGLVLQPLFLPVLLGYYLLTIAYSLWLKRKPILDICVLATLYTLRLAAGGAAMGIVPSVWLLSFSAFLFFALAAVKRQAELVDMAHRNQVEAAGRGYRVSDLPVVTQMATASGFVAVLVFMLYLNEPVTRDLYANPMILWAVCLLLLYWVARMILLAQRGQMDDDPVAFAVRDRVSQIVLLLFAATFALATLL